MPSVPLTSFVDFSVASGTSRLTAVTRANREYDPRYDYYKPLRERTIKQFTSGWDAREFRRSLQSVQDPRKLSNYEDCRGALTRWASGKTINSRARHRATWSAANLDVKVNPDLDLEVDGQRYVMKLYFKADETSGARQAVILHLLGEVAPRNADAAILDARRGRLLTAGEADPNLGALLASDAAAFVTLWGLTW